MRPRVIISLSVRYLYVYGALVLALLLQAPRATAQKQCVDIFTSAAQVSSLHGRHVYLVKVGGKSYAYKIYSGEHSRFVNNEARSLMMLQELLTLARPNSSISVVPLRVAEVNEYGIFERYLKDNPQLSAEARASIRMLVTEYSADREVAKILDDLDVPLAEKKAIVEKFHEEIDYVIDWVMDHPEYRFQGSKVEVRIEDYETMGELIDIKSHEGTSYIYLRNVIFDLVGSKNDGVDVWLDGFSNLTVNKNGTFTVFDPY